MVMVEAWRTPGDAVSYARRSDMSRLALEAQRIAERGRGHWALAKARQGMLEIALREDDSRLRKGHARENVASLRSIALTLRKQTNTGRHGVKVQRNRAGWDNDS
jgi:predicted transposase YbfD/YdcC